MSSQVTLKAGATRGTGKGAARKLRAAGKLPGGGLRGEEEVDRRLAGCARHRGALPLHLGGKHDREPGCRRARPAPVPSLVRDIQTHPYRPDILHVDFLRMQTGVEVELDVPVDIWRARPPA
jgi:large subunit ribosomal protein L25